MFNELTFALRYRYPYTCWVNTGSRTYRVQLQLPLTAAAIDSLKAEGLWELIEPTISPYLADECAP